MLVDSHCHLDMLDLSPYQGNLDGAINAAKEKGVKFFLSAGTDLQESRDLISLIEKYPEVRTSVGLHPTEKTETADVCTEEIIAIANHQLVVAIGETGLDYFIRDGEISEQEKSRQHTIFREHIRAARELKKPLIIHSRSAAHETLQILREENAEEISGVFHCFTYDEEIARQVLDMKFYIGIPGVITFKNAKNLQNVVKNLPLTSVLLETDCPFLAPEPFRGKPNEPAYLPLIAEKIANLKNISYDEVAKQTTDNFFRLFKIC